MFRLYFLKSKIKELMPIWIIWLVCTLQSVRMYLSNVKTTEPIGPNFFVAIHMTPKVNGNFKVDNFAMKKCRFFKLKKLILTEKSAVLSFTNDIFWRWLDDVGLPQYKDSFLEARVDGRKVFLLNFCYQKGL